MRNEAPQARACLESLAALLYEPLEIIVVDDRSTDDTARVVEEWVAARDDARFMLMHASGEPPQGWVGKTFATHQAIERSRGELVLIADADIRHARDSLNESVRLLSARDMLVRLPWVPVRHPGSLLSDFLLTVIWVGTRGAGMVGGLPLSFGAYVLMRRAFYDGVGGFAAHRSFPESLPLARLASPRGGYRLVRPAPAVSADLYPTTTAAARGVLRNINAGLISWAAFVTTFLFIAWPLTALSYIPAAGAFGAVALWCAALGVYARACGRSLVASCVVALVGPVCAFALAALSCAALVRQLAGVPVEWRGRRMRVQ